jgi:hypothetical protein
MKRKNTILLLMVTCSILFLLFFTNFSMIDSIASESSLDSEPSLFNDEKRFSEDIQKLKETTLQQRNDLIGNLLNIIKTDKYKYTGTYAAVDILSQIRAIEATDILLDIIDYRLPISGMYSPTTDPLILGNRYPVVKALVNIRPKHENILKKIQNEDNIAKTRCYIAVMVGVEGIDVSRYLIEKAIKKETETRKIERLKSALTMFDRDFPPDSNNVKPK